MSEPIICFENVSKYFGKVRALEDVSLKIQRGSIFCLLGVNGAGKSTALRLLLNRISPSSGEIRILGKSAGDLKSDDFSRIAYVSESQKLYEWMKLEAQIRWLKPLYPDWDEAYCDKLIELFRLPRDRKIKTFSRGMKMKTKMLLALSFQPEVVVMDEPFSGLDPIVRQECIDGLIDWANEGERTLVISSHDVDDVEPICDQVGILDDGSMILVESLDSLKKRFRRASFHCEGNPAIDTLPAAWTHVKRRGRSFEFLDIRYDLHKSPAMLGEMFPESRDLSFDALSLRELFVGIVKNEECRSVERGRES